MPQKSSLYIILHTQPSDIFLGLALKQTRGRHFLMLLHSNLLAFPHKMCDSHLFGEFIAEKMMAVFMINSLMSPLNVLAAKELR